MTHYRVNQIWADPTGNVGYIVKRLEPFELIPWGMPQTRESQEALDALTTEEREARYPRLHNQPPATPDEIKAGLVGRTILDVTVDKVEGDWPQGDGALILVLDDGNTVNVDGWGYDAWGLDVQFQRLPR